MPRIRIRSASSCMVKVFPAPLVPSRFKLAFLFFFVSNRSTMHSELLWRLIPEQHAGIVRHLEGCEHIGRCRTAGQHIPLDFFFSSFGDICRNGITVRKASSCWNRQSLRYISMDLSISVICCFAPHQFFRRSVLTRSRTPTYKKRSSL